MRIMWQGRQGGVAQESCFRSGGWRATDGDDTLQNCVKQGCPRCHHCHLCSLTPSGTPPIVTSILPCLLMGTPTTPVFPLYESVTSALSAVGRTSPDRKDGHTAIQGAPLSLPERPERGRKMPSPSTTTLPWPGTGLQDRPMPSWDLSQGRQLPNRDRRFPPLRVTSICSKEKC